MGYIIIRNQYLNDDAPRPGQRNKNRPPIRDDLNPGMLATWVSLKSSALTAL